MNLWHIAEFAAYEFKGELYTIAPIWPAKGIMLLHGQQTSGKTQLAMGMLESAVLGERFLGRFPAAPASVVYFQFDLPEKLFQQRARAIADRVGQRPFHIVTDFGYHDVEKWQAKTPDVVKRVQDMQPTIIVVDSIRRCHSMDENDSRAVNLVYKAWQNRFPNSSFLMIHHESKEASGPFQQQAASKPRGSSAWLDNANAGIGIKRIGRGQGGQHKAKLTFTKVTGGVEPNPVQVTMDPKSLLLGTDRLTTAQEAESYLMEHPQASSNEVVEHLQELGYGRTKSYAVVRELVHPISDK